MKVALAALSFSLAANATLADCGPDAEACSIDQGTYHVVLPEGDIKGSVMFLHGAGGSGKASASNKRWVPVMLENGFAVIAPDGKRRPRRNRRGWSFHPDRPKQRDEVAFLSAVRDDAAHRFDLDPTRMMLGGFSIGGSMTHYFACEAPDAFYAYIPVGGAFWRPHPDACNGSVRLLHTHGWTDTTVPLEGRVLRGSDADDPDAFMQGDVYYAMELWRAENGCRQLRGDRFKTTEAFWRRAWVRCDPDTALELALFPGGHTVPKGWAEMVTDWFAVQTSTN
ncbi:MAG: PHB depolymerase family esterase [Paracoccaceae bacterium]